MNYEEVIELFNSNNLHEVICHSRLCNYTGTGCSDCPFTHMSIRIREALEKQIPKKPTYFRKIGKCLYAEESYPMCPVCGKQLDYGCRCSNNDCGQTIDWSEVE